MPSDPDTPSQSSQGTLPISAAAQETLSISDHFLRRRRRSNLVTTMMIVVPLFAVAALAVAVLVQMLGQ